MISRIANYFLPRKILATYRNYKILSSELGQFKSMSRWECIDKNDEPVPWYTYPATEYLNQLDFTECNVFEYGSGNSTIYWSKRCKKLCSVEDNSKWYDQIDRKLGSRVDYRLLANKKDYINSISSYSFDFDIIIIDGSHRFECATESIKKLKETGFIILDNSDWETNTSKLLRSFDLIEVDMAGFGPINGYTWTTSFYFKRQIKLKTSDDTQPKYSIGSLKQ